MPLTGFYAGAQRIWTAYTPLTRSSDILKNPLPKTQSLTSTTPAPPPPDELPKTDREETLAKARIVFGSRLAGPGERAKDKEISSKVIAGIMVPPKPTEPDNCCMSGCVNCVWDMYRDDMEEWAAKSAEARTALQAQRAKGEATGTIVAEKGTPSHVATSMDDDGGGSESNGALGQSAEDDSLFADIPVGIRQFMKTEKMLKQKHSQESAS